MPEIDAGGSHTQFFVYLSKLLGRKVELPPPHASGKLVDLIALQKPPYPSVTALVVKTRAGVMRVDATGIAPGAVALARRIDATRGAVGPPREMMLLPQEFRIHDLLLDKQVVDVQGAKVVRVNDVHLLVDSRGLYVVHVDVGFRGLLRRLGIERAAVRAARFAGRSIREDLISWKYVHPVECTEKGADSRVRLEVTQQALNELHPGELADILEDLDREARLAVVRRMSVDAAAEVLEEVDEHVQKTILADLAPEVAADIVEEMEPAQAVDALATLPEEHAEKIMRHVEDREASEIRRLATYAEGTAGALMTTDFIALAPESTVAQATAELRRQADEVDAIYYVYLTDAERFLRGVVSIRQLVTEDPATVLSTIAQERVVTVHPDTPDREVAQTFEKYGFLFLPVVDRPAEDGEGGGRMIGLVSLQHAIDEIRSHFGQEG